MASTANQPTTHSNINRLMKRTAGISTLTKTRSRPRAVTASPLPRPTFMLRSLPADIFHEFVSNPKTTGQL